MEFQQPFALDREATRFLGTLSLGEFLPDTLAIRIRNQSNAIIEARHEMASLVEEANARGEDRKAWFQKARVAHFARFEQYYRTRVHEKAHWWAYMSSTFGAADVVFRENLASMMTRAFPPQTGRIRVPLATWISSDECPNDLRDAVAGHLFIASLHAVLSGDFPNGEATQAHRTLSALEPDFMDALTRDARWSGVERSGFGLRAIMEGAAVASEWMYILENGADSSQTYARFDAALAELPDVYSRLISAVKAVSGVNDMPKLLALVLAVADQSMCPRLEGKDWHFWWRHGNVEDTMPSIRLRRVLEMLQRHAFSTEREISPYEQLAHMCSEHLGWSPPDVCTTALLPSLHEYNRARIFRGFGVWDKLGALEQCLAVRTFDPEAPLAPVNAELLGALKAGPQLIISDVSAEGSELAQQRYLHEQLNASALRWFLYGGTLCCPCETDPALQRLREHCGRKESCRGTDAVTDCIYLSSEFSTLRIANENDYIDLANVEGFQPGTGRDSLFDRIDNTDTES